MDNNNVTGIFHNSPCTGTRYMLGHHCTMISMQVEFDPNLRLLSGGKRLEIRSAYVTDTGEYRCYATNNAGELERKFMLNVWGK